MTQTSSFTGSGAVRLLWLLCNADGPKTVNELATITETTPESVDSSLRNLMEFGYVDREQRIEPGTGNFPYEYTVSSGTVKQPGSLSWVFDGESHDLSEYVDAELQIRDVRELAEDG